MLCKGYSATVEFSEEEECFVERIAGVCAIFGFHGGRVIYFNQLAEGVIALLMVYTKAKFDNLPPAFLLQLKKEFENAQS